MFNFYITSLTSDDAGSVSTFIHPVEGDKQMAWDIAHSVVNAFAFADIWDGDGVFLGTLHQEEHWVAA